MNAPKLLLTSLTWLCMSPLLMVSHAAESPTSDTLAHINADPPLVSRKGNTLYYTGSLNAAAIEHIVAQYPPTSQLRRLVIDSTGGEVNIGMKFGHWVRDLQLDVEVTTLCFSSCANYIFPAGQAKIIGPKALVGWHGSTFQQNFMTLASMREEIRPSMEASFPQLPPEVKKDLDFERFLTQQTATFFADMETSRQHEVALYKRLQITSDLANLQEYCRLSPGQYTLTLAGMKSLGLQNVSGPADYPRSALTYLNQRRSEKTPPLPPLDISVMQGLNCQLESESPQTL